VNERYDTVIIRYVSSFAWPSERILLAGIDLLICLSLTGCLAAPVKVSKHIVSVNGETNKTVDIAFLKVGSTHRSDVDDKLGWVDTGFKNPLLFWARFSDSTWVIAGIAATPAGPGGGASRIWHERNLMIEFDKNADVTGWEIVEDKHLGAWLLTWLERTKQPPLGHDTSASCTPVNCTSIQKVSFEPANDSKGNPDPAHFHVVLHLNEKYENRKALHLQVNATTLYVIVQAEKMNQ
jgi:hypothetical protein